MLKIISRAVTTTVSTLAVLVSLYTLSPFAAAYLLNCAIKSGDAATMNALVLWPEVKDSLRRSILLRLDEKALARPDSPGWLQQAKYTVADTVSPLMVDYMLGQRVSPDGFTAYMGPHSAKAEAARAAGLDPDMMPSANVLKRIRSTSFTDLTHFQFKIVDRWDAGKEFLATLELRGFMWRLSNVEMLSLGEGA